MSGLLSRVKLVSGRDAEGGTRRVPVQQEKKQSLPLDQCPAGLRPQQYLKDQKASHRGGGSPCPEIVLRGLSTKTHARLKRWMVSGRGSWQGEIIVMCPRDDLPRSPGMALLDTVPLRAETRI